MTTTQNSSTQDKQSMISLRKICNQSGKPELFPMIRNRIGLYCKAHSDMWAHLYTNRHDTADLYLKASGVQAFSGILAEYFGEKEIALLQRDLRKKDSYVMTSVR